MIYRDRTEFSVTFWIRTAKNPGWNIADSNVRFPPLTAEGQIRVFTTKQNKQFRVFVLHPEVGYRKLIADISKLIGQDTFVAITNKGPETQLYLNAELVSKANVSTDPPVIETGDIVMVRVEGKELSRVQVSPGVQAVMPAEVKRIVDDSLELFFFEPREIVHLPRDRLVY